MLASLISAVVMSLTMWFIARHEADMSVVRTFLIAFGVSILTFVCAIFLGPLALLVGFGAATWAVRQFCYLRWHHALVVAAVWLLSQFGLGLLFAR